MITPNDIHSYLGVCLSFRGGVDTEGFYLSLGKGARAYLLVICLLSHKESTA